MARYLVPLISKIIILAIALALVVSGLYLAVDYLMSQNWPDWMVTIVYVGLLVPLAIIIEKLAARLRGTPSEDEAALND